MASSSKNKGKTRKDLLEIVFEMMSKGESKEQIVTTLQEAGLEKKEAEKVHQKAKEEFQGQLGKQMEGKVAQLFEEKEEKMMNRIDSKLKDMKENLETSMSLKESEQKEYTNKKIKGLESQFEDLKNHVFDLKAKFKNLKEEVDALGPSSSTTKVIAFALIAAGIIMIIYSTLNFTMIKELLDKDVSNLMLGLALQAFFILTGIILIKFGKDMYPTKKQIKGSDHSWITE